MDGNCVVCKKSIPERRLKTGAVYCSAVCEYRKKGCKRIPSTDPPKRYEDPAIRHRYTQCRNAARYRRIPFELTQEQFEAIVRRPCLYCGKPFDIFYEGSKKGERQILHCSSLDRKDNSKGYTLENSVPACKFCNNAKGEMTVAEYLAACARVSAYQQGAQSSIRNRAGRRRVTAIDLPLFKEMEKRILQ